MNTSHFFVHFFGDFRMRALQITSKISIFSVKRLVNLVNVKIPKKCSKNVQCSRFECPYTVSGVESERIE